MLPTNDADSDIIQRFVRIQNHKNVQGLILISEDGNPVRSSLDNSTSLHYSRHANELKAISRDIVRDLNPDDELAVLRLRTEHNEIMMLPNKEQMVVCIQACEKNVE
ncbi:unnamed protein product, partial [Hymenolepis diminuta]